MSNCNWETIDGFSTPGDYRRICVWIETQVDDGMAENIPVGRSSEMVPFGFEEKWFKCKNSGEVWRLVAPEPPFRGAWVKVE